MMQQRLKRPDICIVSSLCISRNPRVVKEADALSNAGFGVVVVAPVLVESSVARDAAILERAKWRREVSFSLVTPARSVGALVHRARFRAGREILKHFRVESQSALTLGIGALIDTARRQQARHYSCHLEGGLAAFQVLHAEGRKCSIDMEDWYAEDLLPEARRQRPLKMLRAYEAYALRHAAFSTAPSQAMCVELAETYGVPGLHTVYNSFPLCDTSKRAPVLSHDHPVKAVWFSQTIGPGRGLEVLVDAVSSAQVPLELHLRGAVTEAYRSSLLQRMPSGLRERVHFYPVMPPDDLVPWLSGYSLGIAFEEMSPPSRNLTVTNKILQYIAAGIPVLATPTVGQQEIAEMGGDAVILTDADACVIARLLEDLCRTRSRLDTMRNAAWSCAQDRLSWSYDSKKLVALFQQALAH